VMWPVGLLEAQQERQQHRNLPALTESFDYPLIVSA
jgi:hypothetical protein